METQKTERWQQLCKQASTERDSRKLSELIREIASLLEDKHSEKPNQNSGHAIQRAAR